MRTVLAAVDGSPASGPVLDAALGVATLTGSAVEAVHVHERSTPAPDDLASDRGIPLRQLAGDVQTELLHELARTEVVVGVVGARATPVGRRPVGHVALHLLERSTKPIVVVPPDATGVAGRPPHLLLVAVEGTETPAHVSRHLAALLGDIEVVAVHVLTTATTPAMLDHPDWGLDMWGDEFRARHCPEATDIDLRTGPVGRRVIDAAEDDAADLIVLTWSQDASPGHAAVVREVLERSSVPVLLLPAGTTGHAQAAGQTVTGRPQ